MSNPSCLPYWNIGNEFDRVLDRVEQDAAKQDDAVLINETIRTVSMVRCRPWFLYVHLMGPHSPYVPREPYRSMFCSTNTEASPKDMQSLLNAYDAEIAYTDAQVGRLIDRLKQEGLYDNTCIVLLADHGEQFYEHGEWGHGISLYEEELRVPLVIKFPHNRFAGKTVHEILESVDIAPTLCEIVGTPPDPRFQGHSIMAWLEKDQPPEKNIGFASLSLEQKSATMARNAQFKYVDDRVAQRFYWFDMQNDPRETIPITTPTTEMASLKRHSEHIAAMNTEGLNILVTGGTTALGKIEGILRGVKLDAAAFDVSDPPVKVVQDGSRYIFSLNPGQSSLHALSLEKWYSRGEQSSAHIRLPLAAANPFLLELYMDGAPITRLVLPNSIESRMPLTIPIDPEKIVAEPQQFDPAVLPSKVAAYVWYVPESSDIPEENIDPRLREALTSLGYFN